MYEALGVKDIDKILIQPAKPMPKDPALEHIDALGGQPFQAFRGQDHRAHITAHLSFMSTNIAKNNPMIIGSLEKNIFEHISLMALEQVELEFAQELQQIQMLSQNPQALQSPQIQAQVQQFQMKLESRKAILIAEMMGEFMDEEKRITSHFGYPFLFSPFDLPQGAYEPSFLLDPISTHFSATHFLRPFAILILLCNFSSISHYSSTTFCNATLFITRYHFSLL